MSKEDVEIAVARLQLLAHGSDKEAARLRREMAEREKERDTSPLRKLHQNRIERERSYNSREVSTGGAVAVVETERSATYNKGGDHWTEDGVTLAEEWDRSLHSLRLLQRILRAELKEKGTTIAF